jgi:MoaA/NifB/PqqE/SkfB family radical SAM enzyme
VRTQSHTRAEHVLPYVRSAIEADDNDFKPFGSGEDAAETEVAIAQAIEHAFTTNACEPHPASPRDGTTLAVPLNSGSTAYLAAVFHHESGYHVRLNDLGQGQFVFGDDNTAFGRWNMLVACTPDGRLIDRFPGHGGEIIPGKLSDHIERLRDNVRTGQRRPVQADIDISMACASKCSFCFSADYRATRKHEMMLDKSLVLELIREWAGLGVKVVRFDGGGDPLTHPHLLEVVRLATDLGMQTAILTSGDLLNERQFETFVACRTYIRVSLNAGQDNTRLLLHSPVSTRYNISHVLTQIQQLSKLRMQAYGLSAKRQMLLGATCMIHPSNSSEVYQIAEQAKEAGFDHLSFRVILGAKHAVHFTNAAQAEVDEQFERIRKDLMDESFMVFFPTRPLTDTGYLPQEYFTECLACTHRVLIEVGHRSNVAALVPCGRYRGHGFRWSAENAERLTVFGNIESSMRVADIWMNPHMRNLISQFPQACSDCIDRSANLFFGNIKRVLQHHSDAQFYRFAESS